MTFLSFTACSRAASFGSWAAAFALRSEVDVMGRSLFTGGAEVDEAGAVEKDAEWDADAAG